MISTNTSRARVAVAIAGGAVAATSLAGYSSAAEPESNGSERTIASTLTSAERAQVNDEVAETMRKTPGGKRISLNQIAWPDKGAVMTIPLPGEQRARAANQPIGTKDLCDYLHACLFSDSGYTGRKVTFKKCGFQKLRWFNFTNKTSSWINNQTKGTKATLYYWTGKKVKKLTSLVAEDGQSYMLDDDNRADFIRAC